MMNPFRRDIRRLPGLRSDRLAQDDLLNSSAPQRLVNVLIDKSSSMSGAPIDQVNRGLAAFAAELSQDPVTRDTVQVQLVTFGQTVEVFPFVPISRFVAPTLRSDGFTPMAEAILKAIKETERHSEFLGRAAEVDVLKPHYFLFSDGRPTSASELLKKAAAAIRRRERSGLGAFYLFGVDQAAVKALQSLFRCRVFLLGEHNFGKFFHVFQRPAQLGQSCCSRLD